MNIKLNRFTPLSDLESIYLSQGLLSKIIGKIKKIKKSINLTTQQVTSALFLLLILKILFS
jgi:hypothetical protein